MKSQDIMTNQTSTYLVASNSIHKAPVDGGYKAIDDKCGEKDQPVTIVVGWENDKTFTKPWNEVLVFVERVPEDEASEDKAEDCEHVEVLQSRVAPKSVIDSWPNYKSYELQGE